MTVSQLRVRVHGRDKILKNLFVSVDNLPGRGRCVFGIIKRRLMKEHSKSGLFKSLFGGRRPVPVRAKLPLYIPVVSRPDRPQDEVETLLDGLLRLDHPPVVLFMEAARLLDRLNPLPLAPEQRLRVTNMILSEVNDAFGALFPRFVDQGSGVPETREQRDGISHGVRAVELLAISYKLAFQQDYAGLGDEPARKERLGIVTLRIMELIRVEQLLRAFRYQQLPRHAWRDCNQLFFSASAYADVRVTHVLKLRIFNSATLPPRGLFPEMGSIEQLYLSIQVTGLLDVISWPTHLMYIVDRYLASLDPTLLTQRETDQELDQGQVIIYRNQGVPPRFERSKDELGDAVRVDLRPLLERAAADRLALQRATDGNKVSEALRHLGENERLPVLDLLLHKLSPQQRREPRRAVFEARDAQVHGGFDGVYRFLRSRGTANGQGVGGDAPSDGLSMQSVLSNGGDAGMPRWIVANESDGGVQLRIQESQYAMPLHVGRLVAYSLAIDDAAKVGYVTRLQRVGDGEVEVAIARLRDSAAAVVVEELDSTDQHTLPAVLIHDPAGKLHLLCDYRQRIMTGDRLAVFANGNTYTGAVGEISLSKPEFVMFRLHTAD